MITIAYILNNINHNTTPLPYSISLSSFSNEGLGCLASCTLACPSLSSHHTSSSFLPFLPGSGSSTPVISPLRPVDIWLFLAPCHLRGCFFMITKSAVLGWLAPFIIFLTSPSWGLLAVYLHVYWRFNSWQFLLCMNWTPRPLSLLSVGNSMSGFTASLSTCVADLFLSYSALIACLMLLCLSRVFLP